MTDREIFIVLITNDIVKKADAIVLLEGDGLYRVKKAAELFKQGFASKIVISGNIDKPSQGSFNAARLIPELNYFGIEAENIILENISQNTREQAVEICNLTKRHSWKRIILVASHYHQYRAYLTFLKVFLDENLETEIINAPVSSLTWFEENEWGVRYELLEEEFKKIEKYRSFNHIASYKEAIEYQKWKEKRI